MFDIIFKVFSYFVEEKRKEEEARAREEEAIRQANNWSDADKEAFKTIMTKQKSG